MQLEGYLDIISPNEIRLKGQAVYLEDIVACYRMGYSPMEIVQAFPGVSQEIVYGAIAYYLHNHAEVEAYMQRVLERGERQPRTPDVSSYSPVTRRITALLREHEQELLQP